MCVGGWVGGGGMCERDLSEIIFKQFISPIRYSVTTERMKHKRAHWTLKSQCLVPDTLGSREKWSKEMQ